MPRWTPLSKPWSRQRNPTRARMPNKKKRRAAPFRLTLPATSANLGPAFDAAALAMDLYIKVEARPAANFTIQATGRDQEICGTVQNDHLILATYREICET